MGGAIGVVRRGVEGEWGPAFGIAAIHLDLAPVEEFGISLPAPTDIHLGAADGGGKHGLDGSEVRRGLTGADNAQVRADGLGMAGGSLDNGDEVENPVERPGIQRDDSGRQRGRGEDGQNAGRGAVPRQRIGGRAGTRECPWADGGQPGADEVDEESRIGNAGGGLCRRQAERRLTISLANDKRKIFLALGNVRNKCPDR